LSCTICEEHKEKRFCPAVHGKICAQCCGEQREVTLECPSACPYLQQAREHANPNTGQPTELDREAWFAEVELTEQYLYEHQELILWLSFALANSARADHSLMDRDLIAALSALAKSYQILVNSSLIYEPQTANVSRQRISGEIEAAIREFREAEQPDSAHPRLRDADVLKSLVFLLRMGLARTSGRPKSRAFIDFLLAETPEKRSAIAGLEPAGSRIVIP
jgi:hypothetical protein